MAAQIIQPAPVLTTYSAYSAGTVYQLTNSSSAVVFGTTSPSITITVPGTYLIYANAQLIGGTATITTQTATIKLRRTNNTASDISAGATTIAPLAGAGLASTLGWAVLPNIVYTTSNSNDIITLFGIVSATLGVGTMNVNEASIVAVKIG